MDSRQQLPLSRERSRVSDILLKSEARTESGPDEMIFKEPRNLAPTFYHRHDGCEVHGHVMWRVSRSDRLALEDAAGRLGIA